MIQHRIPVVTETRPLRVKKGSPEQRQRHARGNHEPGSWPRENEGSILVQISSTKALKQVSKFHSPTSRLGQALTQSS
jgi:hypothetical protein